MKRMTVVAGYMPTGTSETKHVVVVKGAPETLKEMVIKKFDLKNLFWNYFWA